MAITMRLNQLSATARRVEKIGDGRDVFTQIIIIRSNDGTVNLYFSFISGLSQSLPIARISSQPLSFSQLKSSHPHSTASTCKIWMHQCKAGHGIRDSRSSGTTSIVLYSAPVLIVPVICHSVPHTVFGGSLMLDYWIWSLCRNCFLVLMILSAPSFFFGIGTEPWASYHSIQWVSYHSTIIIGTRLKIWQAVLFLWQFLPLPGFLLQVYHHIVPLVGQAYNHNPENLCSWDRGRIYLRYLLHCSDIHEWVGLRLRLRWWSTENMTMMRSSLLSWRRVDWYSNLTKKMCWLCCANRSSIGGSLFTQ